VGSSLILFLENGLDHFEDVSAQHVPNVPVQAYPIRLARGILRHGLTLHRFLGDFDL
jgi:hypothetical protein